MTRCRRASTATSSPPGTTRSSTSASSACRGCGGRPSTAIPTAPTREHLDLDVGGTALELHHARGETDDHTWTWVAGHARAVLRRPVHLGVTQRRQPPEGPALPARVGGGPARDGGARARGPAPGPRISGHRRGAGAPGADRHRGAARLAGRPDPRAHERRRPARRDAPHRVAAPDHLLERPYLRPVYDEPEFVVRNVWRLYGGWWDGNPATLKPAPEAALAAELAALAGGAGVLADRALALAEAAAEGPDGRRLAAAGGPPGRAGGTGGTSDDRGSTGSRRGVRPAVGSGHLDHGERGLHLDRPGVRAPSRSARLRRRAPTTTRGSVWLVSSP